MDLIEMMTTFTRIVEAGSLAAAARHLRVSAAAVSRHLATLEAELKAPLILRSTRQLSVTPLGRLYYERCRTILMHVEEAQSLGGTNADVQGLLRVSAPVTFGLLRVAPFVPALLAQHRGLRIDLRLEDHFVDLVTDGVDVAVRGGTSPPNTDSLVAHRLTRFRRVAVASPAYFRATNAPKTPADLVHHELLVHLAEGAAQPSWSFERNGQVERVQPEAAFRSTALYALREAAIRGAGIALVPEWLVAEAIARRELTLALRGWEAPSAEIFAIHRVELRGAPRVRVFVEHLRARYAALETGEATVPSNAESQITDSPSH